MFHFHCDPWEQLRLEPEDEFHMDVWWHLYNKRFCIAMHKVEALTVRWWLSYLDVRRRLPEPEDAPDDRLVALSEDRWKIAVRSASRYLRVRGVRFDPPGGTWRLMSEGEVVCLSGSLRDLSMVREVVKLGLDTCMRKEFAYEEQECDDL